MFVYPAHSPQAVELGANGYAVVDLETTGLLAYRGDRIVEISIVRTDAWGRELGVYSTLVNPGPNKTTGAPRIHRITDNMVKDAPTFDEVASSVLAWLEGAVVVAHNAPFEDGFLEAAFQRAGIAVAALPALDTLTLARRVAPTNNFRLATLASWAGVPLDDAHTAEADARATAGVLGRLLHLNGRAPTWEASLPPLGGHMSGRYLPRPPGDPFAAEVACYELAEGLRKGEAGWIANLLARMPETTGDANAPTLEYVDRLLIALSDGRITGNEAHELAVLAGTCGLSRGDAKRMHREVLGRMYLVAMEDGVMTKQEFALLSKAAAQLGQAGYFDHLKDQVQSTPKRHSSPSQTKCGICGQKGHTRRTCVQASPE